MAWWTVVIFSASSSGISISNSSSRAITSSTVSSESAPRSSTNEASLVTCSCLTPSCSATMALTCCSTVLISGWSLCRLRLKGLSAVLPSAAPRARYCRGTPPQLPLGEGCRECLFLLVKLPTREALRAAAAAPLWRAPNGSPAGLWHVHPAVHVQRLPGDVGRLRRDEEQHRRGHVCRSAETPERNLPEKRLPLLLAQSARHVGVDESGSHGIHRDAARGELAGE